MFHNLFLNETNLNNTGENKVVEWKFSEKVNLWIIQFLITIGCLLIVCKLALDVRMTWYSMQGNKQKK